MTNAEIIRNMTDEELAKSIFTHYNYCPPDKYYLDCHEFRMACMECRLRWLKQEEDA